MNVFTATCRMVRDAETRSTNSGERVTSVPLASDVGFGDKKTVLWLDGTIWGQRGEKLLPFLKKGQQVVVSGEAGLRSYQKNDGSTATILTLRIAEIDLVGGKQEGRQEQRPAPKPQSSSAPGSGRAGHGGDLDEEIPFAPYF